MSHKVALVTGANKGIGFAIVQELCIRKVGIVYLASRDVNRGIKAVNQLKDKGLAAQFVQLEVSDPNSIRALAGQLKKKHGGLDILINNAGVITQDLLKTTYEDAKRVIDINYRSILTIQEYIFPILNENARVINITSDCGHISNLKNAHWIERLTKKDCKVDDINAFVDWFLNSVKSGTLNEQDFAETPILAYRISKIALNALTMVQQREMGRNISVNALHPGFVKTDMTKDVGQLTMEEAAKTPCYLALDAPQSLKGAFIWYDGKQCDWADPKLDNLRCHYYVFEQSLKASNRL